MSKFSAIPTAQLIAQITKQHHISDIVISPGSRNAPLTLQFTNDSDFVCHSIVDERVAGFFALGIAQKTGHPVVLICTSGSALLNYYPAIAESFYSDIPLIVVSADRPAHKIDIGDGQTIRQKEVFGAHVHFSCNLILDGENDKKNEGDTGDNSLDHNAQHITDAINFCLKKKGPVHINVPFEEPLYDMTDEMISLNDVSISEATNQSKEPEKIPGSLIEHWNQSEKKMMLIGVLNPDSINQNLINQLIEDADLLVLTETTSNCPDLKGILSIDQLVAPIELAEDKDALFETLQPDLLITMGGMVVSKKVKYFLRKFSPQYHYHIGPEDFRDTFYCLDQSVNVEIDRFLTNALQFNHKFSNYSKTWLDLFSRGIEYRNRYTNKVGYSDFKVFDKLISLLPDRLNIHFSNSSAIRYAQLFPMKSDWDIYCNRGTSGIDGSLSTAVGSAVYSGKQTVLITGDLSFFYDSNGLWTDHLKTNFKVIIINNSGGGIFRILPGDKSNPKFEKFFETRHNLNAANIAKMYGLTYYSTANLEDLQENMIPFIEDQQSPGIFEIFTPPEVNDKVLLGYFDFLMKEHQDDYKYIVSSK